MASACVYPYQYVQGWGSGDKFVCSGVGLVSMPILGGNFYTKYMYVN